MNAQDKQLLQIIKDCNAAAGFPNLSGIELGSIIDEPIIQETILGKEKHNLKTYLAILLMRTMRDFTDTDAGVYKSHDAVGIIVHICRVEKDLRREIRKQIRNFLQSRRWQYSSPIEQTWTCIYCGHFVKNDGEGFARREHLQTHTGVLPVEADDGFPFSSGHISVARGHTIGCLCGLVHRESWDKHRSYFQIEMNPEDYERLQREIITTGSALAFYREFSWDFDLLKNKRL